MKRCAFLLLTLIIVAFGMTGCSKYASHYNAVAHIHSNDSDSASTSFSKLDGTEVFKLKCKSDETARIQYSGELEDGSLTVYYDCGGTKAELFSVQSGDEIHAYSDPLTADTVYVIIETSEKCQNGEFTFELFSTD